jgi:hypothetical protein
VYSLVYSPHAAFLLLVGASVADDAVPASESVFRFETVHPSFVLLPATCGSGGGAPPPPFLLCPIHFVGAAQAGIPVG